MTAQKRGSHRSAVQYRDEQRQARKRFSLLVSLFSQEAFYALVANMRVVYFPSDSSDWQ